MGCADILPLLAARRELPWAQERQVQEHLARCASCLERWTREERALGQLRAVPVSTRPYPAEAARRARAALGRRRPARRTFVPLALAGALCGALVLLLLFNPRLPWSPSGPTGDLPTETATSEVRSRTPRPTGEPAPTAEPDLPPPTEAEIALPEATWTPQPEPTQPPEEPTPELVPTEATATAEPGGIDPAARPGLLAFNNSSLEDRSGSIVVLDPATGDELLEVVGVDLMDWTVDGQGLIFGRCLDGPLSPTQRCQEYDLFLVDAQSGAETRLTESGTSKLDADAAYDGENIVYAGCSDDGCQAMDLILFNMAGRRTRPLGLKVPLDAHPAWSPSSYEIAFYGCPDGAASCADHALYIQNADGTPLRKLADRVSASYAPAWSPDGTRVAYHARRDGWLEIHVVNADGSGDTLLATTGAVSELAWSPDGTRIVYLGAPNGEVSHEMESDIYVMRADGSEQTRLTTSSGVEMAPAWSPDGQFIAFVSGREPGSILDMRLFLIRPDGSGEVALPTTRTSLEPMWAP